MSLRRDQVYIMGNLQESMYENDGPSMLGVFCVVCFARLDFVKRKRDNLFSQ